MCIKHLGQAVQVNDRLFFVTTAREVWQVCASESLDWPGSFKYVGKLPEDWTDQDLPVLLYQSASRPRDLQQEDPVHPKF